MQAQALQLGRTRVVSFALCGAVLHQLRKPRNAWAHNGGHVAAQAAADALVVDDERARAREAEEVRDIAPAHDGEEGRHLASIEATTSGKCEDGVGAEGDGACAGQPEDERLCRFCFGAASEMPGGLISPCKCKGTQVRKPRGPLPSQRLRDNKPVSELSTRLPKRCRPTLRPAT